MSRYILTYRYFFAMCSHITIKETSKIIADKGRKHQRGDNKPNRMVIACVAGGLVGARRQNSFTVVRLSSWFSSPKLLSNMTFTNFAALSWLFSEYTRR